MYYANYWKLRKMKLFRTIFVAFVLFLLFSAKSVLAGVTINEVMYDLKTGSDGGREWIEIFNNGSEAVTVATSSWKFFESDSNHSLIMHQGNPTISSGGYAVIVDDPTKFFADWPGFSGTIFDSTFSLINTGETIALKSSTTAILDEFTYLSSMGGSGDGNSLQKINGVWSGGAPTPGSLNSNASSEGGIGSSSASSTSSNTDSTTSSSDKSTWPVEPQVFSKITGQNIAIAGADATFKGEAVGVEKKPLVNERFIWNFGDGATAEGESVKHIYNFPGKYVVILEASSGKYTGGSRLEIEVIATPIIVKSVVSGYGGKIVLLNQSAREIDLSFWILKGGSLTFLIPKNTKILPKGELAFASSVTGLVGNEMLTQILYPNGALANSYQASLPTVEASADNKVTSVSNTTEKLNPVAKVSVASKLSVTEEKSFSNSELQTASVANAMGGFGVSSSSPEGLTKQSNSQISSWIYILGGVIVLGVGAVVWPRKKTDVKRHESEAESIEIVEE